MIKTELQKYPHTPTPQKSIEIKKKKQNLLGLYAKAGLTIENLVHVVFR